MSVCFVRKKLVVASLKQVVSKLVQGIKADSDAGIETPRLDNNNLVLKGKLL